MLNNCCGEVMQNRIKEQSNFKKEVWDESVKLLKRIKRSMCIPTRSKCKCKRLLETVKHFVTDTKQEENEDLTTHAKRFKQANDAFKQSVEEG